MIRQIDIYLKEWKLDSNRKVLMLRGARQVGKTYAIRNLGKSYSYYLEVNFELDRDVKIFFQQTLEPRILIEKLSAYYSIPIIPGETLLFFDEVQESEDAIKSLRYFYEKMPGIHLVAAGSLLEFALAKIPSYGVGRITTLFMYPLTYREFLVACEENSLLNVIVSSDFQKPVDLPFYYRLIDLYKTYGLIGGMPEVVQTYIKTRDLLLCQKILTNLIITLKDDFAKYKSRSPVDCLIETFQSIVYQTGSKFVFSNIGSASSHQLLKQALNLLLMAGLAYKIYHTSAQGLPIGAQVNQKKFKVVLFDIGIHQQIAGIDIPGYLTANQFNALNRGNVAELYVGLELIGNNSPDKMRQLYYWHRESKNSNAEVDYIIQKDNMILPIEVKAGTKGQMQSMYMFLKERNIEYGLRISLENFSEYEKIKTMPLFATCKL